MKIPLTENLILETLEKTFFNQHERPRRGKDRAN